MPKRYIVLIVAAAVFLAVALLIPSIAVRAVLAGLTVLVATVVSFRSFSGKTSNEQSDTNRIDPEAGDEESPAETFAPGKLFAATMNGMREGLLVVDRDMRVVASNVSAKRLFNLSRGSLETQRLTEITRNPAIYSAFLDALTGTERSGVKVETHGPERLVFDLRVIPLMSSNGGRAEGMGQAAQGALGVFIDVTR